jgi:hypothetical protein
VDSDAFQTPPQLDFETISIDEHKWRWQVVSSYPQRSHHRYISLIGLNVASIVLLEALCKKSKADGRSVSSLLHLHQLQLELEQT